MILGCFGSSKTRASHPLSISCSPTLFGNISSALSSTTPLAHLVSSTLCLRQHLLTGISSSKVSWTAYFLAKAFKTLTSSRLARSRGDGTRHCTTREVSTAPQVSLKSRLEPYETSSTKQVGSVFSRNLSFCSV